MQPQTPAESSPFAAVQVGMTVVDRSGTPAGTVVAVQPPGTEIRPDVVTGVAEELMAVGYLRVDGTGHLSNDAYAGGDQIEASDDVITLNVGREELHRAV
jgi:hypothetical protein